MALVTMIEAREKEIRSVHQATTCTYTTFVDEDGTPYLQLETYGSKEREIPGKVKQTLQFNERSAAQLLKILLDTFPCLR